MRDGWLKDLLLVPLNNRKVLKALRWIECCKYLDRRVWDYEGSNRLIRDSIASGQPQAIGKLGSGELWGLQKYLAHQHDPKAAELTAAPRRALFTNAGVFPNEYAIFNNYCRFMLAEVLPEMTIFGAWFNNGEAKIVRRYCRQAAVVWTRALHAWYLSQGPWTATLAGKKVLVAHPFAKTIEQQYARRASIWPDFPGILPEFKLETLRVPLQQILAPPTHDTWFEALKAMCQEMASKDFDVALIGAGAYSLPLAVHAKRLGRQGIHLGGALQILFGIKGKRWDNGPESRFYNDHWARPLPEETPPARGVIEDGCYW
jgi:hypothetical protein